MFGEGRENIPVYDGPNIAEDSRMVLRSTILSLVTNVRSTRRCTQKFLALSRQENRQNPPDTD